MTVAHVVKITGFLALSLISDCMSGAAAYEKDSVLAFFPRSRLYQPIFLDPLECQASGGSYFLFRKGENTSLYSNVTLGFQRPVFTAHGKTLSWEGSVGVATFSQFDLLKRDDGSYLAGLLNNDYKLNGDLSIKRKDNIFRVRFFHVSSHLGDDYMLRNNDSVPNDKSVNYEQADLTWILIKGKNYLYAGIGEIYTKYAFRERLSFQVGGLLNFADTRAADFFASVNTKLFAENDFIPDIRCAAGISLNRRSESLVRIWAEYFSGKLPYSTLKYGRISWLGMSLQMNLF